MNILHVITRIENSGPNKVMIALAIAQQAQGATVQVASLQPNRDDAAIVAQLTAAGVTVIAIRGMTRDIARRSKAVDITHVHCLRSLLHCVLARCKALVVTSHNIPDEDWPHTKGRLMGWIIGHAHYWLMARADKVVAINNRMRERIAARRGDVVLLPNPAALAETPNTDTGAAPRRLLCVGHLNSRKNQTMLLDALAHLGPAAKGLRLDLVGDGPLRQTLQNRALSLTCEVRFAGHVDDPTPWFRDADLYVSPALSEGQPIAVLEALGYGLPCVLSDISGHAMPGAPTGAVTTVATNVAQLAQALGRAVAAPPTCPPTQIAEWAQSSFSPSAVAEKYMEIYAKVLAAEQRT